MATALERCKQGICPKCGRAMVMVGVDPKNGHQKPYSEFYCELDHFSYLLNGKRDAEIRQLQVGN